MLQCKSAGGEYRELDKIEHWNHSAKLWKSYSSDSQDKSPKHLVEEH